MGAINAELLAALEPFAQFADTFDPNELDGVRITYARDDSGLTITVGEFRAARAAIARATQERKD